MTSIDKVLKLDQRQYFLYSTDEKVSDEIPTNNLKVILAKTGMKRKDIDKLSKQELITKIKHLLNEYLEEICNN